MAHLDDHRLVHDFKSSGNSEHFAPLFLHYRPRIFRLAYAFHRDRSQAEDCVQETFLRAFVDIDKYDETTEEGNFGAWLQRIARNVCVDEFRRRQRYLHSADPQNNTKTSLTQEEAVLFQELQHQLKTLPREYGVSLLLSADGHTYKDIMTLTGFTYDQVKTFIQTAKRHLVRQFR